MEGLALREGQSELLQHCLLALCEVALYIRQFIMGVDENFLLCLGLLNSSEAWMTLPASQVNAEGRALHDSKEQSLVELRVSGHSAKSSPRCRQLNGDTPWTAFQWWAMAINVDKNTLLHTRTIHTQRVSHSLFSH